MRQSYQTVNCFWFRRDLRLDDNIGLLACLKSGLPTIPIFIFDTKILKDLPENDRRIEFIYITIKQLKHDLNALGTDLFVFHGEILDLWQHICNKWHINKVYINRDYEPYAIARDIEVCQLLRAKNIELMTYKDQVIFEQRELLTLNRQPYQVFKAYQKAWLTELDANKITIQPLKKLQHNFYQTRTILPLIEPKTLNFIFTNLAFPSKTPNITSIRNYSKNRDMLAKQNTTKLGVHFRFGTISIRQMVKLAQRLSSSWLEELIWREFFMQVLYNFPHVATQSHKKYFDNLPWQYDKANFTRWSQGLTGYPLVDAGMRELNQTGFMPNRVRMLTASFLTKHLLMHWSWGERYFAEKLLDYELAANCGNWQWIAGSGVSAAPYFRIFNPSTQAEKYDPHNVYIKKWLPEIGTKRYPKPIIANASARERLLAFFNKAAQSMVKAP